MARLAAWMALPPCNNTVAKHVLVTKGPLSMGFNVVDEALYLWVMLSSLNSYNLLSNTVTFALQIRIEVVVS